MMQIAKHTFAAVLELLITAVTFGEAVTVPYVQPGSIIVAPVLA